MRTVSPEHARWYSNPVLSWISRHRFQLLAGVLPEAHSPKCLEIGYGGGILLPELHRRCDDLHGIDIHDRGTIVKAALDEIGVTATLSCASAEALPYPDDTFDMIVCLSSIEFVDDIQAAARELHRVLRRNGVLAGVTPRRSRAADLGLLGLTGKRAKQEFGDRREQVVPTLSRYFRADRVAVWPAWPACYQGFRMRPSK
jgi:Methylase involved in ubiquinone/menaquinone biosynthesis